MLQAPGEIFKNTFFTDHLRTTASDFLPIHPINMNDPVLFSTQDK